MENDIDPLEKSVDPLRFLTLKEAAAMLQVSQRAAQRMIECKELPAFKVGGQWRISESKFIKWFEGVNER
jgi:excisionase family DNA binding protein